MYKYISYISEQSCILSEADIRNLLLHCRANNGKRGLTGILIHFNGIFTQFLEGPEESVDRVYSKILRDNRHRNIKELIKGHETKRFYKDWSMAYRPLQREELEGILGFRELDRDLLFSNDDYIDHLGVDILRNFVNGLHIS